MYVRNRSWRRERTEGQADRIAASYRALDALASAVLQAGVTAFLGGVAIGKVLAPRYGEIVIVGSFLPLFAGLLAGLAMIDYDPAPPDAARLKKKRAEVNRAAMILVISIVVVLSVFLLLLALTDKGNLHSLTDALAPSHPHRHYEANDVTRQHQS